MDIFPTRELFELPRQVLDRTRLLLPRSGKFVVVEFDHHVVKFILVEGRGSQVLAPHLKVKFLSSDGDSEILRVLQEHIREFSLRSGTPATILIPRHRLHAKIWNLPGHDPQELRCMAGFRLQKEIPLPREEIVYDIRVLAYEAEGSARVLTVMGRRQEIQHYIKLCQLAGLEVEAVRVNMEATYLSFLQTCQDHHRLGEQNLVLVDVDFSATNIYVIDHGQLLFCRSVAQGVSDLIDRAALPASPDRSTSYEAWIDELATGVRDTLAVLYPSPVAGVSAIDEVVLSGWLPKARLLSQQLGEKLGLATSWFEPTTSFGHDSRIGNETTPHYWFSISALIGMADATDQSLMDLRPETERRAQHRRHLRRHAIHTGLVMAYMLVVLMVIVEFSLQRRDALLQYFQNEVASLQPTVDAFQRRLQTQQKFIAQFGNAERTVDLMSQVLEALPAGVELSSFTFARGENLILRGTAQNLAEVLDLPEALAQHAAFQEIVITSADRRPQPGGGELVAFEMKIDLHSKDARNEKTMNTRNTAESQRIR